MDKTNKPEKAVQQLTSKSSEVSITPQISETAKSSFSKEPIPTQHPMEVGEEPVIEHSAEESVHIEPPNVTEIREVVPQITIQPTRQDSVVQRDAEELDTSAVPSPQPESILDEPEEEEEELSNHENHADQSMDVMEVDQEVPEESPMEVGEQEEIEQPSVFKDILATEQAALSQEQEPEIVEKQADNDVQFVDGKCFTWQ